MAGPGGESSLTLERQVALNPFVENNGEVSIFSQPKQKRISALESYWKSQRRSQVTPRFETCGIIHEQFKEPRGGDKLSLGNASVQIRNP